MRKAFAKTKRLCSIKFPSDPTSPVCMAYWPKLVIYFLKTEKALGGEWKYMQKHDDVENGNMHFAKAK